jgi:ABC-type antimicrobial peptide transport system permease subunit
MTHAIFLLLTKHLRSKWVRVLLAQAGIMIGIWAITLTTSLSFGLSDKIVEAINSQPSTKEINLYKVEGDKTNFFEIQSAPKFVLLGQNDISKIRSSIPEIVDVSPFANAVSYIHTQKNTANSFNCVTESAALTTVLPVSPQFANFGQITQISPEVQAKQKEIEDKCTFFSFTSNTWQSYFNTNNKKLVGEKRKPGRNEISLCFKCGQSELGKSLGFSSPEDMIGKSITLEFKQSIEFSKAGKVFDVVESNTLNPNRDLTTSKQVSFKIISVINDEKDEVNFLSGGNISNNYIDFSHFLEEIKRVDPTISENEIGYLSLNAVIDDYNNLESALEKIKTQKYLSFSASQVLVGGVKTLFSALTYFLAGFGLIVLIASVFGIINVMTISVLERKKEIGIVKSLGANNTHIFWIFLLESMILGFLGWLFGTLLAIGSGYVISRVSISLLNQNAEWKTNLEQFNISDFNPSFPPTLLLSTLGLSLFFTILSGLIPAIRASRQHIVEVLRSE